MRICGSQREPKFRRETSVVMSSHTETNKSDPELLKAEKKMKNCKGLLKVGAAVEKSTLPPWLEQVHRNRDVYVEDLGELLTQVASILNFPLYFLDIADPGLCIFPSVCHGTSSI